CQQYYSLPYSF
nr:immunoglobulin light chain junction region [Macaca mulatta]MOX56096.1 immunoglobulin light chain junction region [Macaca mulatta]